MYFLNVKIMSIQNQKRYDNFVKGALVVTFTINGFFTGRVVVQGDNNSERQGQQEAKIAVIQNDVAELKKFQERQLNMFMDYFNRKDRMDDENKNPK